MSIYTPTFPRLLVRELPLSDQPLYRLRRQGTSALSNAELVAALLQTPDALSLAQELLVRFDGLYHLAHATLEELQGVEGIGPARAAQLHAAFSLGLRLLVASRVEKPQIRSAADAALLLLAEMSLLEREEVRVLLLDNRGRLQRMVTVYVGTLHSVAIRVGELFQEAVRLNAASLILVHNHPAGDPTPSPEDGTVTRKVAAAGHLLHIELLDHLVIAGNRYVSMKERGEM
jgi:DNA repair protein RadC